jgi:hypothetical protein
MLGGRGRYGQKAGLGVLPLDTGKTAPTIHTPRSLLDVDKEDSDDDSYVDRARQVLGWLRQKRGDIETPRGKATGPVPPQMDTLIEPVRPFS